MGYIHVPDELEGQIELLKDISKITKEDISEIVKHMQKECSTYSECLSEDVLRFKLFAKDIAKGYKEATQAEIDALEAIWESLENKRSEVYKKTNEIRNTISKTKQDISSLNKLVSELNIYGMDRVLTMLEKFSSMSDKDKELLVKLAEISK